jgi:dipeptidyl aminopeptidase/acylaminoacyl peptidase
VKLFSRALFAAGLVLLTGVGGARSQMTMKSESLLNKGKNIPDIATFMQIGACTPAGYTWNGNGVFIRSSMSGASQIYRLNDAGWPYQLTVFEDGVDFFALNYGGDMAIVGASVGGSEQSQLYLTDTKTGRVIPLTDFEDVQIGAPIWSKDDRFIFYRSNQENGRDNFIYRMDITNGQATKIFGDTLGGVTGYNTVMDLSQDGSKLLIGNFTSNVNDDLYLLDLITGEYTKLTKDDRDVLYDSPTLMPDNKTIWLSCNDNEEGISRLAKMKIDDRRIEYVEDGWIDPKWEIDGLMFSQDYKYMAALVNEDGYVRLRSREVETRTALPSPPLDGIVGGGYFDKDGSMLISYWDPTRAPDVWRWNPHTGDLKQLTFSIYAGIDRELFREPKLIHYTSFDGLEIPAFLYLPPDYVEGQPIPFIVDAHGGPEGQFQPDFIRNFQYLMLNGYGILAPNPRGSSGYGRTFLNLDNVENRKNSLKDYKAGVEWLIANGYAANGSIAIRGGSYGGYVVMGMITEYPDLFAAAIDVVGIVNFQTFLENTADYRRALREAEYGSLSDPEFLASISPIHKADKIKTPLLVIHGENDPRVPVSEARQIIAVLQQNGQAVDSLIFPDEGHGASKRVNVIAEYRKQVEFLDNYLRARETE